MGANTAFCCVMLGLAGVYGELLRPGQIWLGMGGVAALLSGGYFLWQAGIGAPAGALLGAAAGLFLADAFWGTFGAAGSLATAALTASFLEDGIRPALAIPCCLAFGAATMALNAAARRARRNKFC